MDQTGHAPRESTAARATDPLPGAEPA